MGFSKDFMWGAATASYQVEGAYDVDGKGLSIWDALSDGKVACGDNGKVACDHYHRFREDVLLMKEMGLKSYRFSVSWPRIYPDNSGRVNALGIKFYSDLVDELISAGIKPVCTLYHWDMPMWVHELGGWENDGIIPLFERYAETVVEALSDRVEYWLTFNEPASFIDGGYLSGVHAPFLTRGWTEIEKIMKNVLLAHGVATKKMRECAKKKIKIGTAPNAYTSMPRDESEEEIEHARAESFKVTNTYDVGWWGDAIVLGRRTAFTETLSDEELEIIAQPLDFFAFNFYNSNGFGDLSPVVNDRTYPGFPRTAMDWVITPDGIYWAARFLYERYGLPLMITENGMANTDFVMLDGEVHDPQRIDYIHRHLLSLKRALDEGIPVIGYQYWSLMDNFEWALGYSRRFGLIYVDYPTGKRIPKDSARYYAEVIKNNGENL